MAIVVSAMGSAPLLAPCVLFAMRRESAPFRRMFQAQQAAITAPCWAQLHGSSQQKILIVETGIGQSRVARALDWLLDRPKIHDVFYQPSIIVYAGFAGALNESLHVGDVVVANKVVDVHGRRWPTTLSLPEEPGTSSIVHRGRLLTMERLIGTPEEKSRLGLEYQADIVDMESALFAERCTAAEISFGCVRAISDEMKTALSANLVSLLSAGTVSPTRLACALLKRPTLLGELFRLRRDTSIAAQELARTLSRLLT